MSTRIEWCDETINPLGQWCFGPSGTKDNPKPCDYCYARILAKRKMSGCEKCHSFNVPHTHLGRMAVVEKWKKPRNIFIQSMGDLFHDEVPDEWIKAVFEACEKAPQHRYLFLTKNPKRYEQYINRYMPSNMWFGWSQTRPGKVSCFNTHHSWNTFVSIEPIHDDFPEFWPSVDWVIVGAESGNRKGKVIPEREWIENIVKGCRKCFVPVFMKDSLKEIWGEPLIQEYPWINGV